MPRTIVQVSLTLCSAFIIFVSGSPIKLFYNGRTDSGIFIRKE